MTKKKKLKNLDDGVVHAVAVERLDEGFRVSSLDPPWAASVSRPDRTAIWSILTEDAESFEAVVWREEGELLVQVESSVFRFGLSGGPAEARRRGAGTSGRQEIRAPMPGKVVEVLVVPGDAVAAGQSVLLFEAMKMQNDLRSPHDGVIVEVAVQAGQAVEAREPLYVLETD